MSVDFLMRVRDAIRLTAVLASPIVNDCTFMDCMEENEEEEEDDVDDEGEEEEERGGKGEETP
ncbi:hypothetical protein KY284_026259 [Solanum tuberosum]|nr:hypothetical protein KY284_026259 [Solanum tuberosum]